MTDLDKAVERLERDLNGQGAQLATIYKDDLRLVLSVLHQRGEVEPSRDAIAKALAERDGFTWTNERVLMTGRGGSRTRLTFERAADENLAVYRQALSSTTGTIQSINKD